MRKLFIGRLFWVWIAIWLIGASYLGIHIVKNVKDIFYPPPLSEGIARKGGKTKKTTRFYKKSSRVITKSHNIFDPKGGMVIAANAKLLPKKKEEKKKEVKKEKVLASGCPAFEKGEVFKESKFPRVRLKGVSYVERAPKLSMAAVYVRVKIEPIAFVKGIASSGASAQSPIRSRRGRRIYKRKGKNKKRRPSIRRTSFSSRSIRKKSEWRVELFQVGDNIMDARLCAIRRKEIVIYRRGKLQKLSLFKKKKKKNDWLYGAVGLSTPTPKGPGEVKVAATDNFEISRKTVNNWLANPMQYAMSARIMPHYDKGAAAGFRLVWVRKGSLYSQIGLKSGDVVQQINGKNLSIGSALGLYSKLPYAKQLRVNIIRKGVRRSIVYQIK